MAGISLVWYNLYWFSFFLVYILWALGCLAIKRYSTIEYSAKILRMIEACVTAYDLVFVILLPHFTGIPWYWVVFILIFSFTTHAIPTWIFRKGTPRWHQLRNCLTWFGLTAIMYAVGVLSKHPIWFISGSVLLASGLWIVYSEYFSKPAIHQFYSNVDDESIWAGEFQPEEAPSLVMLSIVFLIVFQVPDHLTAVDIQSTCRMGTVPMFLLLVICLGSAFSAAVFIRDDIKRLAASRILIGVAGLVACLILSGGITYLLISEEVILRHEILMVSSSALLTTPGVLSLSLVTFSATLVLGISAAIWMALGVMLRSSRYDVFLSFSSADRREACQVAELCRVNGLRVFFSDRSLQSGDDFELKIERAIRNSKEMAVLYSPNTGNSAWVTREWTSALACTKRVTPILLKIPLSEIPGPLSRFEATDFSLVRSYVQDVRRRSGRSLLPPSTIALNETVQGNV